MDTRHDSEYNRLMATVTSGTSTYFDQRYIQYLEKYLDVNAPPGSYLTVRNTPYDACNSITVDTVDYTAEYSDWGSRLEPIWVSYDPSSNQFLEYHGRISGKFTFTYPNPEEEADPSEEDCKELNEYLAELAST